MRNFQDIFEAYSEIKRDLASFGTLNKTKTMQNITIEQDPRFFTKELVNYGYVIQKCNLPEIEKLDNFPAEYASAEWYDRVQGIDGYELNPGSSWQYRPEIWQEFLREDGRFDYTYAERFVCIKEIIETLRKDKGTRRAWYPIFHPEDIRQAHENVRVPCSLGYNFQIRDEKLHITYVMRSCDFITHWAVDIYMAVRLQRFINCFLEIEQGTFTHFIMSLHVYHKDVEGVF